MNDRARAIALLKQARDQLATQLTEQVLSRAEGILDDARGDSYLSEIESLYEKFGTRLAHLNQMLQHLPPLAEEPPENAPPPAPPATSTHSHLPLGLPAPRSAPHAPAASELVPLPDSHGADTPSATLIHDVTSPLVTFAGFLSQVRADDLPAAAQSLAWLCDLDAERALSAAHVFGNHLANDPQYGEKLPLLCRHVAGGRLNEALVLLFECFGMLGVESLAVLQTLRLRWER